MNEILLRLVTGSSLKKKRTFDEVVFTSYRTVARQVSSTNRLPKDKEIHGENNNHLLILILIEIICFVLDTFAFLLEGVLKY